MDEAAAGRDSGKLLPVLIDDVAAPLGFRQFQGVDLSKWSGRGKPTDLLLSLEHHAGPAAVLTSLPLPSRPRTQRKQIAVAAALAGAVAAMTAGLAYWIKREPPHSLVIAAAASDTSPETKHFAQQVEGDLVQYQPRDLASLTIRNYGGSAQYHLELGLDKSGSEPSAILNLKEADRRGVAWATTIVGKAGQLVDLRQQAAATVTAVLRCAIKASASPARLEDGDYRNFLDGCVAVSTDFWEANAAELIPTFKRITQSNPKFAPAQAFLALADLKAFETAAPSEWKALARDGRAALAQAQALDPDSDVVIGVAAMFHPSDPEQWDRAFPILDRGLKLHPDSVILLGLRSAVLMSAGRMTEAVVNARQALQQDALAPQTRLNLIQALVYSGRLAAGREELTKAAAIWPNSGYLTDVRFHLDLRYGDPRGALAFLQSPSSENDVDPSSVRSWKSFLNARIDPSPAKIDAALDSFRDAYRRNPADIPGYLQALGTFGRVDEAFEVTRNPITLDSVEASTDILFRPHMRSLFSDPRFIELSNRLGLLAYWRKTGAWPDFCADPQLPYDCRKEAAKYVR